MLPLIVSSSSSSPAMDRPKRPRPKGLWKARVTSTPRARKFVHDSDTDNDEHDHDDSDSVETSSLTSSKRRRYTPSDFTDEEQEVYYYDYSRQCHSRPPRNRESCWARRTRIMDTTTTALRGPQTDLRPTCDFEDWEDLRDLFNKAAEEYESGDASDALPLLRGVMHECHRFLIFYQDPSELFSNPKPSSTPDLTPREEISRLDWSPVQQPTIVPNQKKKCTCVELPSAFHALLGTTLFMFGNLIAQDPSLVLEGEPRSPTPYWLASLDVFETGENLPSRTNGRGCDAPEDWRMAIVWGRTLVCIADELITQSHDPSLPKISPIAQYADDEPHWPEESPFAAIAARRPPITRRMSLCTASPNDLMVLAMDQFSRGIFHMPHPQHCVSPSSSTQGGAPSRREYFSRAKELYTIASEVLLLAEKMDNPSERSYWASWADSVFNQMKMEADMDAWRVPITRARGRCWLIVGSARVEEFETALEKGNDGILQSEEAEEAREGLSMAITFLEKAKSAAASCGYEDPESHELQPLLAEALLTLANLTVDESEREGLYRKAQAEGGGNFNLDDADNMDTSV